LTMVVIHCTPYPINNFCTGNKLTNFSHMEHDKCVAEFTMVSVPMTSTFCQHLPKVKLLSTHDSSV
jgi:hypothetical protein